MISLLFYACYASINTDWEIYRQVYAEHGKHPVAQLVRNDLRSEGAWKW